MHLYVELWKARPAWLAMPAEERAAWVAALGPVMSDLVRAGVELVGFAVTDADAPHDADYPYVAVWRMPTRELVHDFESAVEATGWHRYFEQVNVRGELLPPAQVLDHMARAATP